MTLSIKEYTTANLRTDTKDGSETQLFRFSERCTNCSVVGGVQSRDKLTEERRSLSDVIRQEFAERLVLTEDENRRMKVELSELRARLRLEVERVTREKEEELQEVHQRLVFSSKATTQHLNMCQQGKL